MLNQLIDLDNGTVLLVNKPLHWTSFDVTNKIKRFILRKLNANLPEGAQRRKNVKVGHAGTLDPLATGLLIVCVGPQTRNIEKYMGLPKVYTGTIRLGATTPSYDLETELDANFSTDHITNELIEDAALKLTGDLDQVPPVFSAIKKDGKRAYASAREGEKIELEPRRIRVESFKITGISMPDVHFEIACTKGTYIRSLAHDFGKLLNSGSHLAALKRVKIGEFDLKDSKEMEEIAEVFGEPLRFKEYSKKD